MTNGEPPQLRKHQAIFDELKREILSGEYKPGQKLPSEAELVKRFEVSRITAGRAVRDLRRDGLVERRAGSGTYVALPSLKEDGPAGLSFGLLIPNLGQTEIFEPICQGMAEAAGEHALLWGRTTPDPASRGEEAFNLCRQYIDRKTDGVFFAPLEHIPEHSEINRQIIASLGQARIPVVLLDRCFLPYPQRSGYDLVGINNQRAGYVATEHLLKLGCRKIAFWAYPLSAATVEARIAGFREALFSYGVPFDPNSIQRLDPADANGVQQWMKDAQIEAFVCANDTTAGRLMHTLLGLGIRVPHDVRMVGIDDVRYASLLPVPLTTVHQPCRDIGMAAMAVMHERLARPHMPARDVLLSCELVVRSSCGSGLQP